MSSEWTTLDAPALALAEGFAQHVRAWSLRSGAKPAAEAADAAAAAARAVSLALSDGHVCVALEELDASTAPPGATLGAPLGTHGWRAALLASGVVGTEDAPGAMPLVLDAEGRLYLHRYFDYERRLAQRLQRAASACASPMTATARDALSAQLASLFAPNAGGRAGDGASAGAARGAASDTPDDARTDAPDVAPGVAADGVPGDARGGAQRGTLDDARTDAPDVAPGVAPGVAADGVPGDARGGAQRGTLDDASSAAIDWQQIATALAMRGRLSIVSGGPGTGKTTTVVSLLACLIAQQPECRIALAAPTGKAAARMSEAIRERAAHLPAPIRERLPVEAFTIHRLLGVTPSGFAHHAGRRLAIDALVVDEASMLDLALATKLLEAVPDHARVVLLGDKDQLAAVESGAVFAELSADPTLSAACRGDLADLCGVAPGAIAPPAPAHASALRDASVWLQRNFRFAADSGIGRLAAAINAGRTDAAVALLREAASHQLRWIADDAALPTPKTFAEIEHGFAPYFDAVLADATQHAAIGAAFARFRALCAVREGARGVNEVNARLTQRLRARLGARDADPRSPWFIGRPVMVRRNDPVLKLFNGDIGIALPDASGTLMVYFPQPQGAPRAIAPLRLPDHETAFAMTVHKAQGSEFDAVVVLLPAQANRVLTRELLYTAVTRAREHVTLCAGAAVLGAAIEVRTQRRSGLLARLAQAADVG